jgi:hypothetical protein
MENSDDELSISVPGNISPLDIIRVSLGICNGTGLEESSVDAAHVPDDEVCANWRLARIDKGPLLMTRAWIDLDPKSCQDFNVSDGVHNINRVPFGPFESAEMILVFRIHFV